VSSHRRLIRACAAMAVASVLASCVDNSALVDVPQGPGPSPVKWVLITPGAAQIAPGKNVALQVELQDGAGRDLSGLPVTWSSSDTTVATVDSTGNVKARKVGTAHIVAASGQTSAYSVVSVSSAPPPALFVTLSPSSVTVPVQGDAQIFATVKDASGNVVPTAQVTWTSSNTSVASVSASGEVTGANPGSAVITATAGTGHSTSSVSVTPKSTAPPSSPPPPPPPITPPAAVASLFDDYSAVSPHWRHITTMMTDFYYGWTSAERTWAGQHYDLAMSGDGSAWQAANPAVRHLAYALEWSIEIDGGTPGIATEFYGDMTQWYSAHPQYAIETAFLHVPNAPKDSAHRLVFFDWGTHKWAFDPADAGLRAYQVDRLTRLAAGHQGVFLDVESASAIMAHISKSQEYSVSAPYQSAHASLLAAIKQGLGSKMLMINTATYTTSADLADAEAAGAVHLEKANNPLFSETSLLWQWCETLMSHGVFVDFVSTLSSGEEATYSATIPPGNSQTTAQRLKMWELASYYMVVPPSPTLLSLQLENMWNLPYSEIWLRAQEADIGHPTGSRAIVTRGTDPVGQGYTLYSRDFDRALVLLRHQSGWGTQIYTNASAVTFPLPAGETWLPLHGDGTVGAAVTSITLRNSEAAILIKQSKVQ
jgi:hypothetical protein